ncbi:ABC transporter ATP-binding protein [Nocardia higoensis]|uniref:ABC transporter ATP-binding protein n=1 Tax=Nocardia higoensis TaxID=228599 RepID=UPI001FDEFA5D|nr:ABC transporter ATP-binding protein [Nocardia higoensis]
MSDLRVTFPVGRGRVVNAVDGVELEIGRGEIVGLIGESGSGKSTLARAILGLVPSTGEVRWKGEDLAGMSTKARRAARTGMQMVFQDPHSALDPRRTILQSVREPLDVVGDMPKAEREQRALALIERVGLDLSHARRYPHQLSGGQKQRACIARALTTDPELLICDESVAALDVALQAGILNLLQDLRDEFGLSILFVSHDLSVVTYLADRVAVLYLGNVVEISDTDALVERPFHPYSEALFSAQPKAVPKSRRTGAQIILKGEIPSPLDPPPGCRFHTRCPYAQAICSTTTPEQVGDAERAALCHFATQLELRGAGRASGPAAHSSRKEAVIS